MGKEFKLNYGKTLTKLIKIIKVISVNTSI